MLKLLCTTGLCVLFIAGCAATDENYVAVPKAELKVLQSCIASGETREYLSNQQAQLLQVLTALRQSADTQTTLLEQQWDQLARMTDVQCIATEAASAEPDSGQSNDRAQFVDDKLLVGAIEHVSLPELGLVFLARVDTGAPTSSLDARNIQHFERNGDDWIRFTVVDPDSEEEIELERRRTRRVRIIHSTEDEGEVRPVVEMRITLGELTQVAEFTLTSREHLDHPILLGRNVLRDVMVVDVSRRNIVPVIEEEKPADDDQETIEFDGDDTEEAPENGDGEGSNQ